MSYKTLILIFLASLFCGCSTPSVDKSTVSQKDSMDHIYKGFESELLDFMKANNDQNVSNLAKRQAQPTNFLFVQREDTMELTVLDYELYDALGFYRYEYWSSTDHAEGGSLPESYQVQRDSTSYYVLSLLNTSIPDTMRLYTPEELQLALLPLHVRLKEAKLAVARMNKERSEKLKDVVQAANQR